MNPKATTVRWSTALRAASSDPLYWLIAIAWLMAVAVLPSVLHDISRPDSTPVFCVCMDENVVVADQCVAETP
jgi:hypothetical protein